ncbi:uncharacterized protein [Rhodnius prolixus]|uniref:uncharacterized protein n=1 Tax=Rhodnius prolixus TaxID=13249 RepID=UPI003D18B4F1
MSEFFTNLLNFSNVLIENMHKLLSLVKEETEPIFIPAIEAPALPPIPPPILVPEVSTVVIKECKDKKFVIGICAGLSAILAISAGFVYFKNISPKKPKADEKYWLVEEFVNLLNNSSENDEENENYSNNCSITSPEDIILQWLIQENLSNTSLLQTKPLNMFRAIPVEIKVQNDC